MTKTETGRRWAGGGMAGETSMGGKGDIYHTFNNKEFKFNPNKTETKQSKQSISANMDQ